MLQLIFLKVNKIREREVLIMLKKVLILTLIFLLVLGAFVYGEKPIPTSLEKPINLTVRDDDGILKLDGQILPV